MIFSDLISLLQLLLIWVIFILQIIPIVSLKMEIEGFPRPFPNNIRFMVLSNEDINLIANLVTGTNDVHAFALPYPTTMNLLNQTMVMHAIEFKLLAEAQNVGTTINALNVWLSMLDKEFGAAFRGTGIDTEDENIKAQFAGPMYFGQGYLVITATAAVEGVQRRAMNLISFIYYPPRPLRLFSPLYVQFVNASNTFTLATNAVADLDFTQFERVSTKVWFTPSNLTPQERAQASLNFQILHS